MLALHFYPGVAIAGSDAFDNAPIPFGICQIEPWDITFSTSAAGDTAVITPKYGREILYVVSGLFSWVVNAGAGAGGKDTVTLTLKVATASGKATVLVVTKPAR